ncbi:uncharacterized protein LOC106879909 [Octopus bimaculoides]|uniref:uncharacterized protein LOC106879909 n=1 Tax=Octopus bimaculoides TaxID=37653 RepID=UPI00071CB7E2|nr:uncharacterized protein LOC106879909 [Octopus bimaculoides]|eukprot:XP_014785143.1 PREDICTED: uncharacterized protein LOC106879909 [Octopus bimaculoides]
MPVMITLLIRNIDNTKTSSLPRATRNKVPAKPSHEKAMKDYVSSVVDYYKTGGNADLQDVTEALSIDAFQSKDKLARSPVKQPDHQKLMLPKDSGIEESKSDIFPLSPNSLNCADPSSSPLLTPTHVSSGSADSSSSFLPSPLLETPTIHSKINQSSSSFKLLSINPNDLTELFTLPNNKCTSLASENAEPFDCILDDANIHFDQPSSPNSSGEEIDPSDYYTPLKKGLNLIGHSRDQDFCQTNSKFI